jgi:hypothetical protein
MNFMTSTMDQGLTLVHFSAQRKRFLWDRGASGGRIWGLSRGRLGHARGYEGVSKVAFVSETAQVELSGRV